jgi:hypothetical protein
MQPRCVTTEGVIAVGAESAGGGYDAAAEGPGAPGAADAANGGKGTREARLAQMVEKLRERLEHYKAENQQLEEMLANADAKHTGEGAARKARRRGLGFFGVCGLGFALATSRRRPMAWARPGHGPRGQLPVCLSSRASAGPRRLWAHPFFSLRGALLGSCGSALAGRHDRPIIESCGSALVRKGSASPMDGGR